MTDRKGAENRGVEFETPKALRGVKWGGWGCPLPKSLEGLGERRKLCLRTTLVRPSYDHRPRNTNVTAAAAAVSSVCMSKLEYWSYLPPYGQQLVTEAYHN